MPTVINVPLCTVWRPSSRFTALQDQFSGLESETSGSDSLDTNRGIYIALTLIYREGVRMGNIPRVQLAKRI